MGSRVGKHKGTDNESRTNCEGQKRKFRFSTVFKRGELDKAPSTTALYDLPLEMLDLILQKSYLHWILNASSKQRDEEVIRSLISVDVCFNRRITRQRFKKTIWRYLKGFYEENKKRSTICRNNKNYLMKNIEPNDEFINSLLSLKCITEKQSQFIQRQRSTRDKNVELMRIVRSFDKKKFSEFTNCLRQTNQTAVAKIVENGGVVIKVEVKNYGTEFMDAQLLYQRKSDLSNRTKPISHRTDALISQLKEEDIEILNSHLDRQTVVVWIRCRSQAALEHVQKLYESNQLRDVFFENIQPSTSRMIKIDRTQFRKTVVVCPVSINFTHRIQIEGKELVYGLAKLQNEIYVLCRSYPDDVCAIRVFNGQTPFSLQKEIELKEMKYPFDIGSSVKNNYCLYVTDYEEKCVWKITREGSGKHKIIKWLTTRYKPLTLSVSSDGQLLLVHESSSILNVYGSDAELIRSIQLPRDIGDPIHAVETSIGNLIILHEYRAMEEEGESWLSGRQPRLRCGISELTRDGQKVIRRYIPLAETRKLNGPDYLFIDSDDRVFVADYWNHRVILLDSDLNWNKIVCPTNEENEETRIKLPQSLCYDEKKKQLIVGGYLETDGVYVYTLNRN